MSQPPAPLGADAVVPLSPIGYVVTDYARPQETPPQATLAYGDQGHVVLYEPYAGGLDGIAEGWYAWLLTWLHDQTEEETAPLQVVPRGWEGSGRTTGVYATRTPNRHNRIGLSLVRVREVKGNVLHFDGVDLVNGTPVLDIKPYSPTSDTPPGAD
ncbi:tRNA (N6-threonylcarbamoyladenosine(37)-N6)-methyltransferase TrmO [Streptomyces melanogenes]|uniref:tRNA (N6-threonylcarbamoyladenosine(37)-N6)-methyltransferase TrmO n=1 Tax=Streptomyces melanogenes TaxID=67326 RepID=UPI00378D07FF